MSGAEDRYRRIGAERRRVPRELFAGPSERVARDLLGLLLVRREDESTESVVRIVETEAYHESDPASHSHRGRTDANAVMFGPPGHLYVYFTYGMHHCMNISCDAVGTGAAVLLRAAVALSGTEPIRERRGARHHRRDLLRGPARLTQGLGIDRSWDGLDLVAPDSPLRVEDDGFTPRPGATGSGPRTGIRHAPDVPWRYWIEGVPEVSRYTRHPRAPDAAP